MVSLLRVRGLSWISIGLLKLLIIISVIVGNKFSSFLQFLLIMVISLPRETKIIERDKFRAHNWVIEIVFKIIILSFQTYIKLKQNLLWKLFTYFCSCLTLYL